MWLSDATSIFVSIVSPETNAHLTAVYGWFYNHNDNINEGIIFFF